jgi:hypothetical protein
MLNIEQIQAFFFKAMLQGWASGAIEDTVLVDGVARYQAIPFREGELSLLDCYSVNPSSLKSAGTTTIWYQDTPVWFMSYGGHYEEAAIPCLKHALLAAYGEHLFLGGRGLRSFHEGPLVYSNGNVSTDFTWFNGRESVVDTVNNVSLGNHQYWGMSLL